MRLLTKGVLVCVILLVGPLSADQRFIVRMNGGRLPLNDACSVLGCNVVASLEAPDDHVFLISTPDEPISTLIDTQNDGIVDKLSRVHGVLDIEPDLLVTVAQSSPPVPAALYDTKLVPYFGDEVRHGYMAQPAANIVRIHEAQTTFGVAGTGTVAIIDTGVDPSQPVLRNVLVPGYDFTRNQEGGSEDAVLNQSTVAVVDEAAPAYVNGYTAATVGQPNASTLNSPQYAAFGHGTMVAGIVHLVAPQAMIMPFKVFHDDGTGYTSDIVRAIYRATNAGARIINMSFSMPNPSRALALAIDHATNTGVICVASAGNQGLKTLVYPAAFPNVIGVASTTNDDYRSTFSNYGQRLVRVAAPGEGIITTYPYGAYAATWGTSFSAPFVSGTVALLLDVQWNMGYSDAAQAIAHADHINVESDNGLNTVSDLGNGRLDVFLAIQAARSPQF